MLLSNRNKNSNISVYICGTNIKKVNEIKFLDVIVERFYWKPHKNNQKHLIYCTTL